MVKVGETFALFPSFTETPSRAATLFLTRTGFGLLRKDPWQCDVIHGSILTYDIPAPSFHAVSNRLVRSYCLIGAKNPLILVPFRRLRSLRFRDFGGGAGVRWNSEIWWMWLCDFDFGFFELVWDSFTFPCWIMFKGWLFGKVRMWRRIFL